MNIYNIYIQPFTYQELSIYNKLNLYPKVYSGTYDILLVRSAIIFREYFDNFVELKFKTSQTITELLWWKGIREYFKILEKINYDFDKLEIPTIFEIPYDKIPPEYNYQFTYLNEFSNSLYLIINKIRDSVDLNYYQLRLTKFVETTDREIEDIINTDIIPKLIKEIGKFQNNSKFKSSVLKFPKLLIIEIGMDKLTLTFNPCIDVNTDKFTSNELKLDLLTDKLKSELLTFPRIPIILDDTIFPKENQ